MTEWHALDERGEGPRLPLDGFIVWLWRPAIAGRDGYHCLGRRAWDGWCWPGGTPIRRWTPTHWTPVPQPDGPPHQTTEAPR